MIAPKRARSDGSYRLAAILVALVLLLIVGAAALSNLTAPEPKIMAPGENYNQEQTWSPANGSNS